MNEWIALISSVGFPIAACAGLGWFVYRYMGQMQAASQKREDELMSIIKRQGDSLRQIAGTLESICARLETVERKLEPRR